MKSFLAFPVALRLLLILPSLSAATVISAAAAAMKPGEWRKLYTLNMSTVLSEPLNTSTGAASGGILGYADGGAWDPGSGQFLYIGSDHFHGTGYAKFVAYSESTNTWREMPRPSWFGPLTSTAMHGYDHNALNEKDGIFYHRPFGSGTIRRYDIKQGNWSSLPANNNFASSAFGLAHFPELGGLVAADVAGGAAYLFKESTQQWQTLSNSVNNGGGGLHEVAEYNPVHKLVIFGGGNGTRVVYKVDAGGTVTRMKDAPVSFSSSGSAGLLTVDPASGDFLVFTDDGRFFSYDVTTDTWTQQPGTSFFNPIIQDNTRYIWEVVAAPLPKYGVATFVKVNYNFSTLYLFKYAASSAAVERAARPELTVIAVSPNPVNAWANISVPLASRIAPHPEVRIFDVKGRLIERISTHDERPSACEYRWRPRGLPAGIYLIQAHAGGKRYEKKIFKQ